MKTLWLILSVSALAPVSATASTLIFADNFNASDQPNANHLDNSGQLGRRSGLLGDSVQVRSSRIQHELINDQLHLKRHAASGDGRVRFHDLNPDGSASTVWHDFSTGIAGQAALAGGGYRISFDWTSTNSASDNWVAWSIGFPTLAALAEPGTRVNNAETDFGILFRGNGGVQYFDNNVATTSTETFSAASLNHQVVIEFKFDSYAEGSDVVASAWVDGTNVLPGYTFQWNNNDGAVYFELGSYELPAADGAPGTLIDNLSISAIPEPSLSLLLAAGGLTSLRRRRR